jgi:hypothetical protein
MAAQVPGLLDALQAAKNSPELTGLLGLTAYHGSPYRFSKFDPTKIGTGEGAQAYGYGHYFAEAPAVAGEYRRTLREPGFTYDGQKINQTSNPIMGVAAKLIYENKGDKAAALKEADRYAYDVLLKNEINKLDPNKVSVGSFYTVDIPDDMIGKMLDWDKPIGQQSETIQRLAKQVGLEMDDLGGDLVARFNAKRPEGAAFLREQGIPGIRYLDQGSRTEGKGTRNFVVFPGEEEAIKMLKVE